MLHVHLVCTLLVFGYIVAGNVQISKYPLRKGSVV